MSSSDAPTDDDVVIEIDEKRNALVARLGELLGDGLIESHVDPGLDIWVRVHRDSWVHAGEALRYTLGARSFGFVSAIDWMPSPFGRSMDSEIDTIVHGADDKSAPEMSWGICGGETRLQVFARVANIAEGWGITLKADIADDDPRIASWIRVYAGADWHEREAWEMFGIQFDGHPALRNIYLPAEFEGHPLRKDFPLVARMVKPWPGIVDTEPMPSDGDDAGDESASEEAAE